MKLKPLKWIWDEQHSTWNTDSVVGELYVYYDHETDTWECGYGGGVTIEGGFTNATHAKNRAELQVLLDLEPHIEKEK